MSTVKSQIWYEQKKTKEANILYERMIKKIINENDEEVEVSTKDMAVLAVKKIPNVNVQSKTGQQLVNKITSVYNKIIDNNNQVTEDLVPDLSSAGFIYVKSILGLSENKISNKRLLKEGWGLDDLGKAIGFIISAIGDVFQKIVGPKLIFTVLLTAIFYGVYDKIKTYLPDIGENIGKAAVRGTGAAAEAAGALENVGAGARSATGIVATGARKGEEKANILAYCETGKGWKPGVRVNKGEYLRVKMAGDPNLYIVEVAEVDEEGDENNPPRTRWNPGNQYKCPSK